MVHRFVDDSASQDNERKEAAQAAAQDRDWQRATAAILANPELPGDIRHNQLLEQFETLFKLEHHNRVLRRWLRRIPKEFHVEVMETFFAALQCNLGDVVRAESLTTELHWERFVTMRCYEQYEWAWKAASI